MIDLILIEIFRFLRIYLFIYSINFLKNNQNIIKNFYYSTLSNTKNNLEDKNNTKNNNSIFFPNNINFNEESLISLADEKFKNGLHTIETTSGDEKFVFYKKQQ